MPEPEQWQPIPGFEDLYEVSDLGRVKSVARRRAAKSGSTCAVAERILRQSTIPKGYKVVGLRKDGKTHPMRVHRLVALAFLGPPPTLCAFSHPLVSPRHEQAMVCHNDGNPANNRLENLRYGTAAENCADRVKHGTALQGSRHPNSKLTDADVLAIRARRDSGESIKSIAADYPYAASVISAVASRKRWKHLP